MCKFLHVFFYQFLFFKIRIDISAQITDFAKKTTGFTTVFKFRVHDGTSIFLSNKFFFLAADTKLGLKNYRCDKKKS